MHCNNILSIGIYGEYMQQEICASETLCHRRSFQRWQGVDQAPSQALNKTNQHYLCKWWVNFFAFWQWFEASCKRRVWEIGHAGLGILQWAHFSSLYLPVVACSLLIVGLFSGVRHAWPGLISPVCCKLALITLHAIKANILITARLIISAHRGS